MRNLDSCRCWRCRLCPCKVRNKFLVNLWNRTILLCIPCIIMQSRIIHLRIRNASDKICRGSQNTVCSTTFSRRSSHLWHNVTKLSTDRQVKNENIIWHMRFACSTNKATNTHSECALPSLFHGNSGNANAPLCYFIRTLPVMYKHTRTEGPKSRLNRGLNTSTYIVVLLSSYNNF